MEVFKIKKKYYGLEISPTISNMCHIQNVCSDKQSRCDYSWRFVFDKEKKKNSYLVAPKYSSLARKNKTIQKNHFLEIYVLDPLSS